MGALLWAQLALISTLSAGGTVTIEGDAAPWRKSALAHVAREALADSSFHLRARLASTELSYEVLESPSGQPLATGTIDLTGLTRAAFEREITNAVTTAPTTSGSISNPTRGPPHRPILLLLVITAALFVGGSLLMAAKPIVTSPLAAWRERRALRWTVAFGAALGAVALILQNVGSATHHRWLIYGCGGIAWGLVVTANARVLFPAFAGLGRVDHGDVFRLLQTWSSVSLLRIVRAAFFYAPFMLTLWLIARTLELSDQLLYMIAVPVWALLARFWLLALVEHATLALDRALVIGDANEESAWHASVKGYFLGYVRRLGWPDGEKLVNDVLFLPGEGDSIALYGGGLTASRIVIGEELLEFGLAPYGRPHDYEAPREDKLFWSDWHLGLIVPSRGQPIASREARTSTHDAEPGDIAPKLGQPPTLAGFVEPSALDKRHSFRPAEDPTWLEWDPGNEHDGTDAGDHDFLFGALVRELGLVQRRSGERLTLVRAIAPKIKRLPDALRRAGKIISAPYRFFFESPQLDLAEAFAVVNHARHHLAQYFAWNAWSDDALLSARAFAPELERQSSAIYRRLQQEKPGPSEPTSPQNRLQHLASFGRGRHSNSSRWRRRVPLAIAAIAVMGLITVNVIRAINYHPRYLERVAAPQPPEPQQGKQLNDQP